MPKAWHLLVVICFGMPVAAAFSYAAVRGAGALGYALLIPLSVMLGFACAWLLEIARIRLHAHVVRPRESVPGWYPQVLYIAAILWMVIAWGLGLWMSATVLQVVR